MLGLNVSYGYYLFVDSEYNIFDSNIVSLSIFNIIESSLKLSFSNIISHNLIIYSTISIIEIFNITTDMSKVLLLNKINSNYGTNIKIYDSLFMNNNNGFELYIYEQDIIEMYSNRLKHLSINIFNGNNSNNLNNPQSITHFYIFMI